MSSSLISRNAGRIWFFGSNFASGLCFALPIHWAAESAISYGFLFFVGFAIMFVVTAWCFFHRGFWAEVLLIVPVFGALGLRCADVNPYLVLAFPFGFLAMTGAVGAYLLAAARAERSEL